MKRTGCAAVVLTLLVCMIFALTTDSYASDSYISKMDVVCTLDKYGNCETVITADMVFGSAADSVMIPVGENAKKISVSGGTFSKKKIDGIHWLVLRNASGTTGTRTFVISYTQSHTVTVNSDKTQSMDIEVLCPYWNWRIDDFHFTVNMPKEFDSVPTYISGYYGDGVAIDYERTSLSLDGTILNPIMDQESLHIQLELPKGYCRVLHQKGSFATPTALILIALMALTTLYWATALFNKFPTWKERRQPPEGIGAWEYPYVSSNGKPELAYLMIEWANLGYVSIHVSKKNRITIRKEMEMGGERLPYEVNIFRTLFAREDICQADTAFFRKCAENAAGSSAGYWNPRIFEVDSGNPRIMQLLAALILGFSWARCVDFLLPTWSWRFLLILPMLPLGFGAGLWLQNSLQQTLRRQKNGLTPVLIVTAASIGLMVSDGGVLLPVLALAFQYFSAFGTFRGGKRTEGGMRAVSDIQGFRRELRTSTSYQFQLQLNQDSNYYYKILPYAEIMGIGKSFSETFENIRLDPCPWYFREDAHYRTANEFYPFFTETLSRMQRVPGGGLKKLLRRFGRGKR